MQTTRRDSLPGSLRLLFEVGTVAGMSDGELIDRFLDRRTVGTEAAEIAFGALVERHGPMVLRVCRARLGDEHDAQDAFQATFLILARKARSIRSRDSAASWLQGVARRVAACARRASAVRRARERLASRSSVAPTTDPDQAELVPAVREEVGDLPEKYRAPLMLCLLDGLTHEEAATRLGWPVGTVKTRVRQAKDRLRTRLTRRGFAPALGAIVAAMTARDAHAMPLALVRSTSRAALRHASGKAMTAGATSASVATLVELGIGSLFMSRIKIAGLIFTTIGALAVGTAGYARQGPGEQKKAEPAQVKAEMKAQVEPPKAAVAEADVEELLDQAAQAKIDLEILQEKMKKILKQVMDYQHSVELIEARLNAAQLAKTFEELTRASNETYSNDTNFEKAQKQAIDQYSKALQTPRESVKVLRALYTTILHQYRREERKSQEMDERAARAKALAESKIDPEVNRKNDSEQLDSLMTDSLKLDLLRMEAEFWKNRINSSREARAELQKQARLFRRPYGMNEKEFEAAKSSLEAQVEDAAREHQSAIQSYEQISRKLIASELEFRDKAKGFSPTARSEFDRWKADAGRTETTKPPADVERRLSDVERKLDLILKAVEARPTGK